LGSRLMMLNRTQAAPVGSERIHLVVNGLSVQVAAWIRQPLTHGIQVEPQRGELSQPRPTAWVKKPHPIQRLSPEGATYDLLSIPHLSFLVRNP
jgi:hypothetical protein